MSSWARVGVKCVCVDAGPLSIIPHPSGLNVGSVYTIAYVSEHRIGTRLLLVEAKYPSLVPLSVEEQAALCLGFGVNRFRPLTPPKAKTQAQDVALFKSLLVSAPELVE